MEKEIKELIADPNAVKIVSTVSREGVPHAARKGSLHLTKDGYLAWYELIETSITNRNMVYALWFHKRVAISLYRKEQAYLIEAEPYRTITAGRFFEEAYQRVDAWGKDYDLSAVWLVRPVLVVNENPQIRRDEERKAHPILTHLDRLVVEK